MRLLTLCFILAAVAIVSSFFSLGAWFLSIMLLIVLLWQYRQQHILLSWMRAGAKKLPPDLSLPYDEIAACHYRAREQSRKRKHRLQGFLSVYHRVINNISRCGADYRSAGASARF